MMTTFIRDSVTGELVGKLIRDSDGHEVIDPNGLIAYSEDYMRIIGMSPEKIAQLKR